MNPTPKGGGFRAVESVKRNLRPWRPSVRLSNAPFMETYEAPSKGKELLGVSILSALSVAGIHSAVNPSYFTLRSFAAKPEARGAAEEGLWIGLGAGGLASVAIGLVFDEWIPAAVAGLTAATLFGMGMYAVRSTPLDTVPRIQEQAVA